MADQTILSSVAHLTLINLLLLAAEEFTLAWGFKGELKNLEKRLKLILVFLSYTESRPTSSSAVGIWLGNLKGGVYAADAVLDEFQYEVLRQKIKVQDRMKNKVTDFFSLSKSLLAFRQKLAHKIKNINSMLDGINKAQSL